MSAAKQNWPRVRLGEVCEEVHERIASAKVAVDTYVTTDNMLKNCAGLSVAEYVPEGVGLVRYDEGDVLLANIRPYLKKLWRATHDGGCSSDVVVFRSRLNELSSEYLFAALSQDRFFDYVMLKPRGTKMPRGDRDWMKDFEFPLPPLPVQREIVARLVRELGAVDELAKKFEELEQVAQAESKAELKETFKGLGNRTDGTDGTDGTNGTHGTNGTNATMGLPSRDVVEVADVAVVSSSPTRWVRLGEVGQIITGSTPAKIHAEYYGKDFPLFKPTDLNQGAQTTSASDSLSKQGWAVARHLPKDSVLVTCIGATLGKAGIIRREGSCNQQINAILCEKVLPEFAYYWIVSPAFQGLLWEGSHSTTLPIVNKSDFSKKPIPLPPLPVQRSIVARLDVAKARKEALVSAAKRGRETAAVWRKAILKEAFE